MVERKLLPYIYKVLALIGLTFTIFVFHGVSTTQLFALDPELEIEVKQEYNNFIDQYCNVIYITNLEFKPITIDDYSINRKSMLQSSKNSDSDVFKSLLPMILQPNMPTVLVKITQCQERIREVGVVIQGKSYSFTFSN